MHLKLLQLTPKLGPEHSQGAFLALFALAADVATQAGRKRGLRAYTSCNSALMGRLEYQMKLPKNGLVCRVYGIGLWIFGLWVLQIAS